MKNYYEILEVNQKASQEVIEKAYRVLVKKYHPDLYSGEKKLYAEQKTKDINEAYRILSDTFLKEQYDTELEKEYSYDRPYTNTQNRRMPKQKRKVENNNYSKKNSNQEQENVEQKNYGVGTLTSMFGLVQTIFKNVPKKGKESKKTMQREDWIAIGLTIIIMLILGVILWFIPATNGFIRTLIPFI
ncbi:MAG: J domain-containing protein [Clostridia bacterium]